MAVSTSQSPFKFVLFGSHSPGKSSLRSRFTDGKFVNQEPATPYFWVKRMTLNDVEHTIELWDTPRMSHPPGIPIFWRHLSVALLVFDVSRSSTLDALDVYIAAANACDPRPAVIIIGNKADAEIREVTEDEGQQFATLNNAVYVEASAKTGLGVQEVFTTALKGALLRRAIEGGAEARNRGFPLVNAEPSDSSCSC